MTRIKKRRSGKYKTQDQKRMVAGRSRGSNKKAAPSDEKSQPNNAGSAPAKTNKPITETKGRSRNAGARRIAVSRHIIKDSKAGTKKSNKPAPKKSAKPDAKKSVKKAGNKWFRSGISSKPAKKKPE